MQSSNIPSKIPLPFAFGAGSGYKNTIPVASQIGVVDGRASLTDGFPPLNFTPISSGGVPPFGGDMNGILNEITAIQQWQQAGGFFPFDSAFAATVGGYPKGAIIQASSANGFSGLWLSNIENNSNNPDTTGTGWTSLAFEGLVNVAISGTTTTLTASQSAFPIILVTGTLTANTSLIFPDVAGQWIVINSTTGSYTLTAKTAAGTGVLLTQNQTTYIYGDATNINFADSAKVASFNGRVGTVTLSALDVTTALGYTPYNATNPAGYITFAAGTRLTFAQASAPTGWTQDTTDTANNRMIRVVNSAGGGTGGVNDPILMNVVPTHTHGFTTGANNVDHVHYVAATTGAENTGHTHGISDPGHYHTFIDANGNGCSLWTDQPGPYPSSGGPYSNTNSYRTQGATTGITGTGAISNNHNHSFATNTGGQSANHNHSGSTDGGSSQTNWAPRYINLIICTKN